MKKLPIIHARRLLGEGSRFPVEQLDLEFSNGEKRTYERMPIARFDDALSGMAAELIDRLADLGVVLVGIDSASIDPASSKTLDAHQAIRQRGLRVLENLVLDDVPEGDYELIALPLKLTSADASPVRAVLRSLP